MSVTCCIMLLLPPQLLQLLCLGPCQCALIKCSLASQEDMGASVGHLLCATYDRYSLWLPHLHSEEAMPTVKVHWGALEETINKTCSTWCLAQLKRLVNYMFSPIIHRLSLILWTSLASRKSWNNLLQLTESLLSTLYNPKSKAGVEKNQWSMKFTTVNIGQSHTQLNSLLFLQQVEQRNF